MKPNYVLLGVGGTTVVATTLSIYALISNTKFDHGEAVAAIVIASVVWAVISVFVFKDNSATDNGINLAIAFCFGIYIIADAEMVMGKDHHCHLTLDDYVIAVLIIYIDIFIVIMRVLLMIFET